MVSNHKRAELSGVFLHDVRWKESQFIVCIGKGGGIVSLGRRKKKIVVHDI